MIKSTPLLLISTDSDIYVCRCVTYGFSSNNEAVPLPCLLIIIIIIVWSSARHYIPVNQLKLLHPYRVCHTKKEMHSRDTTVLIDLL